MGKKDVETYMSKNDGAARRCVSAIRERPDGGGGGRPGAGQPRLEKKAYLEMVKEVSCCKRSADFL